MDMQPKKDEARGIPAMDMQPKENEARGIPAMIMQPKEDDEEVEDNRIKCYQLQRRDQRVQLKREARQVAELPRETQGKLLEPNVISFNAVIGACNRKAKPHQAL